MKDGLRAIDINAIDESLLNARLPIVIDDLPTCFVPLNSSDVSTAVLSWRWDIDSIRQTSRNVSIAVRYARQTGIRHLFMDKISIDQGLPSDDLLKEVMKLAALYTTLPTIAAYDEVGISHWRMIMRRPWIAREVRAFWLSPCKVTYVGYIVGQGTSNEFGFRSIYPRVANTNYADSILMVLCEHISMATVSDLKFLIPEHAQFLTIAYETLIRNDYLLTAAILEHGASPDKQQRVNGDLDVYPLPYERYTFRSIRAGLDDHDKEILFDGKKVGAWYKHYNIWDDSSRNKFVIEESAIQTLYNALDVPTSYWHIDSRGIQHQMNPYSEHTDTRKKPDFEVVLLDSE